MALLPASSGQGAAGPVPARDPLASLEREIRADLATAVKLFTAAPERPAIRARVEDDYRALHDLRNREAFAALWSGLGWRRDPLRLLYVASGSHLAPLTLLFSGAPPKVAEFTFTEIDSAVPGRVRTLLNRLERFGLKDLAEHSSGRETVFTFALGSTTVTLRIVLGSKGGTGAGDVPFTREELERSDVVVTHDWAGDQRDNLALLFDIVRAACDSRRQRPLAVFMEDLEAHPFPIDLTLSHPAARTPLPYGHLEHVALSDGTRMKAEDGPALYGGAVALVPDQQALCALGPSQLETVFNVLLFSDFLFDRSNVDQVGGRKIAAPRLLDLATGYGYRAIRGEDVRGVADYPSVLVRQALDLLPSLSGALREGWCHRLEALGRALREAENVRFDAVLARAEARGEEHPFLSTPQGRRLLEDARAHRDEYVRMKNGEKAAARKARELLDRAQETVRASCGCVSTPAANAR
jgi:hypothetical protein